MFIKICGITNLTDAQLATDLGGNALGFIFAPSKRQIEPVEAAEIISHLPQHVEKVGVFVNETKEKILRIGEQTGLSCIQLHGDESPQLCTEIGIHFKTINTVKVDPTGEPIKAINNSCWKILLDTYIPNTAGGTGKTFNWEILKEVDLDNVIVAGGLTPGNISNLLSRFSPFGVDLSSGVEAYPGKKDHEKLKLFFDQVKLLTPK